VADGRLPRDALKSSFAPVTDLRTRVLILGSLPGDQSLAKGQYYGNRQNQFWRLIGDVLGRPMPEDYGQRLALLAGAGVGLWDVIGRARRVGSLDASIRDHEPNPLPDLVAMLPALRAIAFNGATAAAIGRTALSGHTEVRLISLPSSSPAWTLRYELKLAAWRELAGFLTGV